MNLKEIFNIFEIEFTTIKDSINGSITMCAVTNEMLLNIAGFNSILCEIEDFPSLLSTNIDKLHINDIITIDDVNVRIKAINTETFEELNSFYDRLEQEELNW